MKQRIKNHQRISYNKAVTLLNKLCEGLGDAFKNNWADYGPVLKSDKMTLSDWVWSSFSWSGTPEGGEAWNEMVEILDDIKY